MGMNALVTLDGLDPTAIKVGIGFVSHSYYYYPFPAQPYASLPAIMGVCVSFLDYVYVFPVGLDTGVNYKGEALLYYPS